MPPTIWTDQFSLMPSSCTNAMMVKILDLLFPVKDDARILWYLQFHVGKMERRHRLAKLFSEYFFVVEYGEL